MTPLLDPWYYLLNDERHGPVSLEELRSLVASGTLQPTDEVWREGTPDWLLIRNVADLSESAAEPPPAPRPPRPDHWHYLLNEDQHGPVSLDELRSLIASETLKPTDEVRRDGTSEWLLVRNIADQAEPSAAAQPATPGDNPPAPRKRPSQAGRPPFRSALLGWLLKLTGLAWVVTVFAGPHLNQSFRWIVEHSQTAGQIYLFWVLYLPGFGLIYWGNRLCLRTFAPGRHPDPRPPIVYLRGFDDDGRGTFQPDSFLARAHGIESPYGRDTRGQSLLERLSFRLPIWVLHPVKLLRLFFNADRHSAEAVLAEAFRRHGPFVAIGRPGEWLATPGADRMYVNNAAWQQVVLDHLARCRAVVLQPSASPGIRWEVEQTFGRVERHRILLSMINFHRKPAGFESFRRLLREQFGLALPADIPDRAEPCFVYFEGDGKARVQPICYTSPLVWSFTNTAVDVKQTFRAFVQGWDGGPRDRPRQPRSSWAEGFVSLVFPLAFFAMLILFDMVIDPLVDLGKLLGDLAGQ